MNCIGSGLGLKDLSLNVGLTFNKVKKLPGLLIEKPVSFSRGSSVNFRELGSKLKNSGTIQLNSDTIWLFPGLIISSGDQFFIRQ